MASLVTLKPLTFVVDGSVHNEPEVCPEGTTVERLDLSGLERQARETGDPQAWDDAAAAKRYFKRSRSAGRRITPVIFRWRGRIRFGAIGNGVGFPPAPEDRSLPPARKASASGAKAALPAWARGS